MGIWLGPSEKLYKQEKCKIRNHKIRVLLYCITNRPESIIGRYRNTADSAKVGDSIFTGGPTGKQKIY
jgi:hypothetical protein